MRCRPGARDSRGVSAAPPFLPHRYDDATKPVRSASIRARFRFALYQRGQCYHMGDVPDGSRRTGARRADWQAAPFYLGLLGKSYGEAGMKGQGGGDRRRTERTLQMQRYVAPHCYAYVYQGWGTRTRPAPSGGRASTAMADSRRTTCRRLSESLRSIRRTAIGLRQMRLTV